MKAVGIKVLKAKLSEFVRLAKAGETILVTERDEVVAELRPARRQALAQDALDEELAALADRGAVTLPSADAADWRGFGPRAPYVGRASQDVLDALRSDDR